MALEREIDKIVTKVRDKVDEVKSETSEAAHRAEASAEREKRELAGDDLTAGEKAVSLIRQAKDTAQANVLKFKRELGSDG
jgi:vacuolar-type H+-ATPase subunit E/Vma4